MPEALLIFRKDARHLRFALAALLLLAAVRMVIDILLPRHTELIATQTILGVVFLIAATALVYAATQQERIAGDCQYWLTRPLPWRCILAAKLLFLGAFVVLPVFLSSIVALAANGVSPYDASSWMPVLVVDGIAVIALATVTRTTVPFVLTLLAYLVLLVFMTVTTTYVFGYESNYWGSAQGVRGGAEVLVFAIVAAAVLVRQYRDRSTGWSQALLSGAALVTLVGLPGWHLAFTLLEKLAGAGDSGSVRLSFTPERGPQGTPGGSGWSYWPGQDVVGVKIPIAITGIPEGAMLIGERIRTTIDAPGGRHWDSGWRYFGGISGDANPGAGLHRISAEQEARWLAFNVDRSFYDGENLKNTPARIQTVAAFSMLSAPAVVHLPVPSRAYAVAPGEFCSVTVRNGSIIVPCVSSTGEGYPDMRRIYRVRQGQRYQEASQGWTNGALSAWGFSSTIALSPDFSPSEVEIATRHHAGFFERTLTIDQIRLGPYEVGRSRESRGWGEGVRNVQ